MNMSPSHCPGLDAWSSEAFSDKDMCSTSLLQDFNVILHIKRIQMTRVNGSSQPYGLILWWNDVLAHPSHCSAVKITPSSGRWVYFSFTVLKGCVCVCVCEEFVLKPNYYINITLRWDTARYIESIVQLQTGRAQAHPAPSEGMCMGWSPHCV